MMMRKVASGMRMKNEKGRKRKKKTDIQKHGLVDCDKLTVINHSMAAIR